jgi:DNA adenine methylase
VRPVARQATARATERQTRDVDSRSLSLTPPLKWAGGKRWLLSHIHPIWRANQNRRYVEPFCGGLAVALGLQPERALLNDINPHLINFYRQVRRGLTLEIDARYNRKLFYAQRALFNHLISNDSARTKQAAQLFYYLNRTCFNGLCRFNRDGEFNVPFGQYKKINYATDFNVYQELFRRWKFANKDLARLAIEPDDFIYADPPYDVLYSRAARCV